MPSSGQRLRTVEHTDVIETQKSALEHIHAIRILAINPPREIQQEFVKYTLEKTPVGASADAFLDLVDAPGRPGMHRRVDVAERPFVGGQLSVRVHVPFAQQKYELFLGKIGIYQRQRNGVER